MKQLTETQLVDNWNKLLQLIEDTFEGERKDRLLEMYKFFEDNYSILWDSPYNKLRNDVCHSNNKERGKYTLEQIDETRNIVLLKAYTGLVAKNIAVVDFFESSVKIDEEKLVEEFLKLSEGMYLK